MQTLVANIFDSWTVLASNTQLSDSLDLLEATGLALEQSAGNATIIMQYLLTIVLECAVQYI